MQGPSQQRSIEIRRYGNDQARPRSLILKRDQLPLRRLVAGSLGSVKDLL